MTTEDFDSLVTLGVTGRIATVTLNRPHRNNGWTAALEDRMAEVFEQCASTDDVTVILLTGAGRSFCVGGDMDKMTDYDGRVSGPMQRLIPRIPQPVIAVINGPCAGVGLSLALACDLRFASATATFSTAFTRIGLAAEYGMSWLLPRLVGKGRAFDLLISARRFSADDAYEYGLVQQVHPAEDLMAGALAYAGELVENVSPYSMAMCKQLLQCDLDRTLASALDGADAVAEQAVKEPAFAEGVASFLEGRPARFEPWRGGMLATGDEPEL